MARTWTAPAQGAQLSQPALSITRQIVVIDDWGPLGIEQIGTKPKQWFEAPDGSRWLFKKVTSNPAKGGGSYLRGDDWAEVISSDIARLMGLPTATVELAEQLSQPGVISRTVAQGAALVHGNEVLTGRYPAYASSAARINPLYTVSNVMTIMWDIDGPPDSDLTAPAAFAGYLALDALVGNTDRHHQNWAVLRPPTGSLCLSPTFDHASSLGFLLNDRERSDRLASRVESRTVATYATRARTPFESAVNPTQAALQALELLSERDRNEWITRVTDLAGEIDRIVSRVPDRRMSEESGVFATRLVEYNRLVLLREARRIA